MLEVNQTFQYGPQLAETTSLQMPPDRLYHSPEGIKSPDHGKNISLFHITQAVGSKGEGRCSEEEKNHTNKNKSIIKDP